MGAVDADHAVLELLLVEQVTLLTVHRADGHQAMGFYRVSPYYTIEGVPDFGIPSIVLW